MRHPYLWYHLPPLLYAAVVIGLSSIPDLKSPILHKYPMDKILHFAEYAIFAGLTFRSFYHLPWLRTVNTVALATVGALALFAGADELYQSFIPRRRPDLYDYLTDMAGVLLVVAILWVLYRGRRRQTRT